MKVIGFHNPEEDYGFLSNWYHSEFCWNHHTFSSMEQYMMYQKAHIFHDDTISAKILGTDDTAKIKKLGRLVSGYDDHFWSGIRQLIVYDGLLEKFSQNTDLRNALLNTGNSLLAECAVRDRIWGIGLSMSDPGRLDPSQWKGQNLLGYALMMTRTKLQSL